MSLLEAARWAPSSYNGQPWRFLYARRDTPPWPTFVGLMSENNQRWAGKAGVLIVVVSRKLFEHNGQPARTHSFDTGAAWASLADIVPDLARADAGTVPDLDGVTHG